ncbi:MAG: radical SAM protein [Chloroflexi bacterium]|jgi:MoaA/NifB/PqqE/SkfB family radical SAM enzyme|nr:radical SAM protein [Chloroflexota bacterium]MBT7080369.1 radical SAM protein [Chloroflexota bacterium]MBT7289807.1 radical SAM protein [Chloroflexota bacterium]
MTEDTTKTNDDKQGIDMAGISQMLMTMAPTMGPEFSGLVSAFMGMAKTEQHQMSADWIKNWVTNPESGGAYIKRLMALHPNVLKKFVAQMMANVFFRDHDTIKDYTDGGVQPPGLVLISPSMRCNYKCVGCYAAQYSKDEDMSFETLDGIITEAKELGTRFFIILGGEPLVYRPLFDIFEKHNDVAFQFYTNGALIDKDMARRLVELGNVAPQISVEGFEEETDERRGKGAFARAMRAMDNLREAGCVFAFSTAATSRNIDSVTSDKFMDLMIEKGAIYGWYFLYMPVDGDSDMSLMPTPEQRNKLRMATNRFRKEKPILMVDFWNDAPLTGGCINGGRNYLHINHRGDVEPCIFCHMATHNLNDCSLAEALNSDFFKHLRAEQPYSYNTLRPCPLIDHPHVMREAIEKTGAYPTHNGAEKVYTDPKIKAEIDKYAGEIKKFFNPIWEKEYAHWAGKWETLLNIPVEQVEARKKQYLEEG